MFNKAFLAATFLIIVLFSFISCENQNTPKEERENELVDTVSTISEKLEKIGGILHKAMLEQDYETMLKYYADDVIISADFHPITKGKAAVREAYEKNKKMEFKYHSFDGKQEDIWESGDKVYDRGTFGMSFSYKDHPKPLAYYGSYFTVWQKGNADSLKIKYFIWNLGFNPCD